MKTINLELMPVRLLHTALKMLNILILIDESRVVGFKREEAVKEIKKILDLYQGEQP